MKKLLESRRLSKHFSIRRLGMALRDNSGNIAILAAATLVPLAGAAGMAVDFGRAYVARSNLQQAVSASALAGAAANPYDDAARKSAANDYFEPNYSGADAEVDVALAEGQVTVTATDSVTTSLAAVLGVEEVAIGATATAIREKETPICMLALDEEGDGISLTGTSKLEATGCAVHSNSSSDNSLETDGTSSAVADSFCAHGAASGDNFSPKPYENCSVADDPFAHLPVPDDLDCDYEDTEDTVFKNETAEVSPGVYCGGLQLQAHAVVKFEPGLYVIKDGAFSARTHSQATGDGVTFYFYGDGAGLEIDSQSTIDFKAPDTGPYAGLVFVQHKDANPGHVNKYSGGPEVNIVGSAYFPTQGFEFTGGSVWGMASSHVGFVAASFEFKGNATLQLRVDPDFDADNSLTKTYSRAPRLTR